MHRLLQRQLRRVFGRDFSIDKFDTETRKLLELISETYIHYDEERDYIEHTLNLHVVELQKEKEHAESASHAKSEFLTNMSHELRTPLHAILSFTELALEQLHHKHTDKVESHLDTINKSSQRLYQLIDDLLKIANMQSGQEELGLTNNNIIDTINISIADNKETIESHDSKITITNNTKLTKSWFDLLKIANVLSNLISNAIKFSPPSSEIKIIINDSELPALPGSKTQIKALAISIEDTGSGIPQNELETVFDLNSQSSFTKTGAGGRGLGLTLCKQIISYHNGTIYAENIEPKGTRVTFSIPVNREFQI